MDSNEVTMSENDRTTTSPPGADARAIAAHGIEQDIADVREATATLSHLVSAVRDEQLGATCNRLVAAVDQLRQSTQHLLGQPNGVDQLSVEPVRVSSIVRRVVTLHDPTGRDVTTRLTPAVARLDTPKVERIVDNLIRNALQHTPQDTHVTVTLSATDADVELTVRDDGPGRAHEQVAALLAPDSGARASWTGLGIVARFVQLHGGTVTAAAGPSDTGLEVRVRLPRAAGTLS